MAVGVSAKKMVEMWSRATSKGPAQCRHCEEKAKELALSSTNSHRNFLTATALGLRFRSWLTDIPLAFLRMNLPHLYTNWITNCQANNGKDCGIAGYRLSKHPWFVQYCGTMLRAPQLLATDVIERIDLIEFVRTSKMSGSKEIQRKKQMSIPKGVDPNRIGWPGLCLQN